MDDAAMDDVIRSPHVRRDSGCPMIAACAADHDYDPVQLQLLFAHVLNRLEIALTPDLLHHEWVREDATRPLLLLRSRQAFSHVHNIICEAREHLQEFSVRWRLNPHGNHDVAPLSSPNDVLRDEQGCSHDD